MELFLSQFHLLRPYWLLALIPALVLFIFLLKRRLASARWNGIIDEDLMPHVLDQMPSEQSRWPLWFVLFAWLLTCISLAGPTWQQLPQPVQKKEDALVIVLDMSLSMAAQDVSPDRATRARQKVIDILQQRNEGLTAMVVYAGDAYTVTPLTDDADTIVNLVPALSPFIMPAMGSRPDKALTLAKKLIIDSGLHKADFLLITDGIQKKDIKRIKKSLGNKVESLSVLTVGTEEGAPIAMQGKGFKRDKSGNIVLPRLELDLIKDLSSELNIRWHQMSFDDTDWQYLLQKGIAGNEHSDSNSNIGDQKNTLERQFDLWADQGYWLLIVIIIIAALSFRRGWMLSLLFLIGIQPENSYAGFWDDSWQTKDQQGQQIFEQAPEVAAELFEDSNWKGSSHYRAGDYQQAAENFIADTDAPLMEQANSHFNRANALAHTGKLEESIAAYDKALELDEAFSDASFNKHLVEELLKQQEQEQENQEKSDNEDQQNSDKKDSEKQDPEKQDSENKNSEQSDQQEENSEQDESQQDSQKSDSENEDSQQDDSKQAEPSDEKDDEKSEAERKAEEEKNDDANAEEKEAQASQPEASDDLTREERQALKQWLNRIPDDPGGLLKRKFLYQYKQREHQDEGEVSW